MTDSVYILQKGRSTRSAQLGQQLGLKDGLGIAGAEGILFAVNGDAYAFLALAHAERAAELDLAFDTMLLDQLLQFFHDLPGTLQMAGTANANHDLHSFFLL